MAFSVHGVRVLFVCAVLFMFFGSAPVHAETQEFIETFQSHIKVEKDGSLHIREDIEYVFTEDRHGIYRCIPKVLNEKASSPIRERYVEILILDVAKDGAHIPHEIHDRRNDICIQIGDPDATISGTHTYTILYDMYGSITFEDNGGADLYYNVTGHGWDVPIKKTIVTVQSDDGLIARERACYRGKIGKTDSCKQIESQDGIVVFTDGFLFPHEGVTIIQALDRSKITRDIRERYTGWFTTSILTILGFVVCGSILYRFKIRYKTGKVIIPQYGPYEGVKPMYMGYLFDRRLDARDIAAGILYLAQHGFIRIRETHEKIFFGIEITDYEITLLKPDVGALDEFERVLLALFFKPDALPQSVVHLRDIQDDATKVRENMKLIGELRSALKRDLQTRGFFTSASQVSIPIQIAITLTVFVGGILSVLVNELFITIGVATGIIIVSSLTILFICASGRRTRKGYEALDHLRGFKQFLEVTDRERFIFHNAPEHNATNYLEYLAYAIAFGVEKEWTKTFEGITIPSPEWYQSESGISLQSSQLVKSLGGFSSALTSGIASSTHGGGGGGFSGGGAGGGGGGSW